MAPSSSPPRLTSDPLPPYSYVPGRFPHPITDPRGHGFGRPSPTLDPAEIARWPTCHAYLRGIDLFNCGYYWEAHESWEAVWLFLGRRGREADFVKGLIKLAAAGVKAREGRSQGVVRHAVRAKELFLAAADPQARDPSVCGGLSIAQLTRVAEAIADRPPTVPSDAREPVVVFPFVLQPRDPLQKTQARHLIEGDSP